MTTQDQRLSIFLSLRALAPRQVIALSIFFIAVFVLLPICGLWLSRSNESKSSDVTRYAEFLRHFPPAVVQGAPSSIPANATNASLNFWRSEGGIGPSNTSMEVKFTLPPAQAVDLLNHTKAALAGKPLGRDGNTGIALAYGDQILDLTINPTTGSVRFLFRSN